MIAWSSLQKKMQPSDNTMVVAEVPRRDLMPAPSAVEETISENAFAAQTFTVERGRYAVEFVESLGAIKSFTFYDYRDYVFTVDSGAATDAAMLFERVRSDDNDAVHFRHVGKEQTVTKSYYFGNSLYDIELKINVQNTSGVSLSTSPVIIAGILHFSSANADNQYISAAFSVDKKIVHLAGRKAAQKDSVEFVALRDRYFCLIVDPSDETIAGKVVPVDQAKSLVELRLPAKTVQAGGEVFYGIKLFGGPQDIKIINEANTAWTSVVHYGPFDVISHVLLQIMGFFYGIVHNWGWAIILLSLTTYMTLFPLSIKQMRSMKEMQKLQPHIEELRKAHKDNPQKMNKEIMELYRIHKVNPLSGCLPIILQMPIFFALYPVLMRSAFLRGADFLWIKDLSSPDRIAILPLTLPFLKNEVNVLPVVLAILMFIQQKMTIKGTSNSSQAEQQKMMMVIMPVMFGFIFYHMPAGLVLYWLVNSVLMLIFQLRLGKAA